MLLEILLPVMIGLIVFLLVMVYVPFWLILVNLFTSFYFFVYGKLYRSKYPEVDDRTFWTKPVRRVAKFWHYLGRLWHGYELVGVENIPQSGPAIIVLYHATVPIDAGFFLAEVNLQTNRKLLMIVDRMAFKIPGYRTFLDVLEHSTGTIESCVETIKRGDLLGIYPGGTNEAFLTDDYNVIWRENAGFAKIAKMTNCPIIPVFTQNTRQVFGILPLFIDYFKNLYRTKKIGFRLFFGWFPVKMRTFIGAPVIYEETDSVEEICSKAKKSMQTIISRNQRVPNNVAMALLDRIFYSQHKKD